MAIVKGITTTISIDVAGDRFRNALGQDRKVYVTLQQNETSITKHRDEFEVTEITETTDEKTSVVGVNIRVHLTKEETNQFDIGGVQFQIRWEDNDGNACGSKVVQIPVGGGLEEKEN